MAKKSIHHAIKWGLAGAVIEGHYLPERGAVGFGAGMTEGVIRLFVNILVQQIELDLKTSVEKLLRYQHGNHWWWRLPESVQRLARVRYEWSRKALGTRRVTRFPDICWLTFGDTLKTLDAMSPEDWKKCLHAETRRQRVFCVVARRVKAFRDYHIAHPKPREVTTPEIAGLCGAARRLAVELCPVEWTQACAVVRHDHGFLLPTSPSDDGDVIAVVDRGYRRSLSKWWEAHYGGWTKWKAPNQGAAANRRPAGQPDGSGNLSATAAADRAFPAAVAELGR